MQRTVKGTKVNLAKMEMVNGNITITDIKEVLLPNLPEDVAIKKAQKLHKGYGVLSVEKHEQLYFLDDEIFFKYATPVTTEE